MTSNQYANDGSIGVDFDERTAGTGTSFDEGGKHKLGRCVKGTDDTEYMYVHAGAAITLYDAVAIDENFEAVPLTSALAKAGHKVGFAQTAFDDNDFGWVAIKGNNINGRMAAECAPDIALYTSGTAGVLDDDSSSVYAKIHGVVIVATATATGASAGFQEMIASYVHPDAP